MVAIWTTMVSDKWIWDRRMRLIAAFTPWLEDRIAFQYSALYGVTEHDANVRAEICARTPISLLLHR